MDCSEGRRRYPWGDDGFSCERATYYDLDESPLSGCGRGSTATIASTPLGVSPYGVYDMAGNAREIVADCFHLDYDGAPNDGSAWTTDCASSGRMSKGGSHQSGFSTILTTSRTNLQPGEESCCGVRCCADR